MGVADENLSGVALCNDWSKRCLKCSVEGKAVGVLMLPGNLLVYLINPSRVLQMPYQLPNLILACSCGKIVVVYE